MEKETFYISTPIYYPSDKLHIGHAYCTTIADSMARYKRLTDVDVLFVTGSDEHGQKIQRKAAEQNITPKEYVDKIVAGFQALWEKLNISNDEFIRTTEKRHYNVVQEIFKKIYDKGDIYKSTYEGLYCTPCETFWIERQLVDGKCPDCGRPVETVQEESYFFRMSKYQDRLLQFIEDNPDFIQPVSRKNEMINFIKGGLEDLCISRTTFDWGIPVPIDNKHVIYVWFDALSNYLTAAGYLSDTEKFNKFWPADIHLVGKEIVRFHTIIWPIILMALELELPKKVYGHGWLVVDGDKMSKSKGNVIDPVALIDEFGADSIRYFLLREINLGLDGNFSREALIQRINADLANDLGNLLHRTLSMVNKFNGGLVKNTKVLEDVDTELIALAQNTVKQYQDSMDKMEISVAIRTVWNLISRSNKYIDLTGPWALAKDESKQERLQTVMYNLIESLRIISVLIAPFMPNTAPKIWKQLGLGEFSKVKFKDIKEWGTVMTETKVEQPEQIFPRIEEEKAEAVAKTVVPAVVEQKKDEVEITIDEFAKVDLRVVKVLAAEKVEKADKLLKLKVDLGTEQREIVSGIAKHYAPEELVGKNVVMVINLKPAKIRGIVSQGMVLAASCGDELKVVEVEMPEGSKVK
ncbi:MAG: methionine--tRNA ligase [Negativicutes bacterium]|nr:methionine--tRNA ligase [Negativicutes bacterium]MBP8628694.1 methionine--tRNA ligase [Negativicutes bacterium]MBP9537451.1 methionine--tRNA ligase [Negativicutes bacterium]MBP9948979.1 methionine--tRNA ligase [Negativicutes bacterium]